nr:hypothetical protein [uncultured Sphingomonas sp.]
MSNVSLIDCGNGFWNLRAPFKIKGLIDIGTQASLIEKGDGRFIWLDCAPLEGEAEGQVMELTDGGENVDAVLNLHPFHTVFCEDFYRRFPNAAFFGSVRHKRLCTGIPWQTDLVEGRAVADRFGDLLSFTVPRGVDYISIDESVHFSSVMAFHRASRSIHSDDTLMYLRDRFPISMFPKLRGLNFHPKLAQAMQKRAGAVTEFREWAREVGEMWRDAARLCAAHNGIDAFPRQDFKEQLAAALERVEPVLRHHEQQV